MNRSAIAWRAAAWVFAAGLLTTGMAARAVGPVFFSPIAHTYTGTAQLDGRAASYSYNHTQSFKPFAPILAARDQVLAAVRDPLTAAVADKLRAMDGYVSHGVTVRWPLNLEMTGIAGTAQSRVSVSGPTVQVIAEFRKSEYGITAQCRAIVQSGVITLNGGVYDAVTGVVSGLTYAGNVPTHSVECETSWGWVPLIGDLIDDFVNSRANSAVGAAIRDAFAGGPIVLKAFAFAGIEQIPNGVLPTTDFDLGAYLRDNLPIFLASNPLGVRVRFDAPFAPYGPQTQIVTTTEVFAIALTQPNLSLSLVDRVTWKKVCPKVYGC